MFLWGLLGCTLGLLIAPFRQKDPYRFAKAVKLMAWGILRISGIKVIGENTEKIEANQPCIYLANHQSSMDVMTYSVVMPKNTTGLAKSDVLWVPLLGWWYAANGGTFIHRRNKRLAIRELAELARRMREEGLCVAMMPEGTRNKKGRGILPFKKGAFHLAIQAQVPLVPVICSPLEKVFNVPTRTIKSGTVIIRTLDPIFTKGLTEKDIDALLEKTYKIMKEGIEELERRVSS